MNLHLKHAFIIWGVTILIVLSLLKFAHGEDRCFPTFYLEDVIKVSERLNELGFVVVHKDQWKDTIDILDKVLLITEEYEKGNLYYKDPSGNYRNFKSSNDANKGDL